MKDSPSWEPEEAEDAAPAEELASADPLAAAVVAAQLGEVTILESPEGVAVALAPTDAEALSRTVALVGRLKGRIAVTARPRPGVVGLSLTHFAGVEVPDEKTCLVRVGAGATVRDVEARAIQAGLTIGPLLPSTTNKTVGAWIAGPTRGERSIPGGRIETAALALEAVLPDASHYVSREAPRGSTGPDLDALLLGGEGRFGIVTRVTLRLQPRALAESAAAREAAGPLDAIDLARRAVHDGLNPAEARWERAHATLEARFTGTGAAQRARRFGKVGIGGREIRGHLELAGSWKAWAAASPLRFEALQLVALHTDGAFGVLQFESQDEADRAASHARAIGFAVVSPRRLRPPPETGWSEARGLYAALTQLVDPKGVLAR